MWKPDGWDGNFKLGVVTPHADIGPEAEAQALLSNSTATVHGARVDFSSMHPGGNIDEKIAHDPVLQFIRPEIMDHVVAGLAHSPLDAIGLAFTSSSFKIGHVAEQRLLDHLSTVSHGISLITTAAAATAAIEHLELDRVAIMAPSWFDAELCELGRYYFTNQGINIVDSSPSGPPGGPLAINAETMARSLEKVSKRVRPDAIFVAGNGQRAIGAIDYAENTLGITVLTANQVLVWAALADSGLQETVQGYGRLFKEMSGKQSHDSIYACAAI